MRDTGQLESCDLAPLPSLEATSSTPPTTLEGNNVRWLSQGDFAIYVWCSWKPERAWKPGDIEKKTRTDCQLLSKPMKLTSCTSSCRKMSEHCFRLGMFEVRSRCAPDIAVFCWNGMPCRTCRRLSRYSRLFHTVVASWSACFMLSPAASLCAEPGEESSRIAAIPLESQYVSKIFHHGTFNRTTGTYYNHGLSLDVLGLSPSDSECTSNRRLHQRNRQGSKRNHCGIPDLVSSLAPWKVDGDMLIMTSNLSKTLQIYKSP